MSKCHKRLCKMTTAEDYFLFTLKIGKPMIDRTGVRDNRLGNPVLTEEEIRLKF